MADDWIRALARVTQSGLPQDTELKPASVPDWYFDKMGRRGRSQSGETEALPLGDLADPISQIAAIFAPMLRRGLGEMAARPPLPPGSVLANQRGNLGLPPVGMRGGRVTALPESVARDAQGDLIKFYHGTGTTFPDFSTDWMYPGSVPYGPGTYTTRNPDVASWYAQQQAQRFPQVRPVYLDVRRPFVMERTLTADEAQWLQRVLSQSGHDLHPEVQGYVRSLLEKAQRGGQLSGHDLHMALQEPWPWSEGKHEGMAQAKRFLKRAGYDSISNIDVGGGMPTHQVHISWSPNQVYPSFGIDALLQAQGRGQTDFYRQLLDMLKRAAVPP